MTEPSPSPARAGASGPSPGAAARRVLLIVPCLNEEASIGGLLREIAAMDPTWDVVVIDDGSTDDTFARVTAPAVCIRHLSNLGIGAAVQTGLKYARLNEYASAVQVDGDGQHPPDQIAELLAAYDQEPANVIVGSRYIGPRSFQSTLGRRLGSRVIGWTLQRLYGRQLITDPTSGMRLFDRAAITFFAERYPHDYPEPISLAWALRSGLTVREVPVSMRAREHGASSIGGLRRLSYMVRVVSYILLSRVGRRR